MTPYTLIVASASRPHLLWRTLSTLLHQVDQTPEHLIIHDDAAFPERDSVMSAVIEDVKMLRVTPTSVLYGRHDPPIMHGPALKWLLDHVETEYVLYTQDDHEVIRPLLIRDTLEVMHAHSLHYVRFNKRDTMPYKETWHGRWYKVPMRFLACRGIVKNDPHAEHPDECYQTLTVSDHWHFQTALWRVSQIKPIVDWFMDDLHEGAWFSEHCEMKINNAMNGNVPHFPRGLVTLPPDSLTVEQRERDASIRAHYQRTFIYGGIDEKAFIKHIGGKPEDWALPHAREAYDGKAE